MAKKTKTQRAQSKKTEQQQQSGTSYWQRMGALAVHLRLSTKLRRAVERLGEYARAAERYDGKAAELAPAETRLSQLIEQADGLLKRAITVLEAIPKDWKPERRAGGAARAGKFVVGGLVQVREKRRAAYDLPDGEQLRVVEVRPHSVLVRAGAGAQLILPFAHVQPVENAKPQAPRS